MAQMSPAFEEELLRFLGWIKEGDLWKHPKYSPTPKAKPDLNSPDSYWWLLNWLILKDYTIKYLRARYTKTDHYFCICKKSGVKWSIRDFPVHCPNQALLTAILRIKRFPEGQPRTKDEMVEKLNKGKGCKSKDLKGRLKMIKKGILDRLSNPPTEDRRSDGSTHI